MQRAKLKVQTLAQDKSNQGYKFYARLRDHKVRKNSRGLTKLGKENPNLGSLLAAVNLILIDFIILLPKFIYTTLPTASAKPVKVLSIPI